MRAILLNEAGGVDKLVYQDIDKPTLKSGELLVHVKDIGINPMDVVVRSQDALHTAFLGEQRPAVQGGVGHMAIQIAKHLGARVIATALAKNRDFVLSLGADQHIGYTTQPFHELLTDIDFVLNTIGGETLSHSIDVVRKGGTIVTIIPQFPKNLPKKRGEKRKSVAFGLQAIVQLSRLQADRLFWLKQKVFSLSLLLTG